MIKLFETLLAAMAAGTDTVMVSVVETAGSTPREPGAHMLVSKEGRIWGTVGGGILEGRALELSARVLKDRAGCSDRMVLRNDTTQGLGSVCGGEATLHLRFISHDDDPARKAALLAVELLSSHQQCRLFLDDPARGTFSVHGGGKTKGAHIPDEILNIRADKPQFVSAGGFTRFVQPLLREERVFIFGGGHVAQALVPVLSRIGFRCIIIDDRPEFTEPSLFEGVEETFNLALDGWADKLKVTGHDYICIMTRGHEKDIGCLEMALHTPARYIGLMGSRKKIAYTHEVLKTRGFTDADINRIVSPIGLDIGAETPAEIAISIAAQMIRIHAGLPL